jgi:type IV secretory pathway ATPase VirB11/archaellum biosynthesis ATPase
VEKKIVVVCCKSEDCSCCSDHPEKACWEQPDTDDTQHLFAILECSRGILHFSTGRSRVTSPPIFGSNDWETVFLGKKGCKAIWAAPLLDLYAVGPYLMFFQESSDGVAACRCFPFIRTPLESALLESLADVFSKRISKEFTGREAITAYLSRISSEVNRHIQETIPEVDSETQKRLSEIVAHKSFALGPLVPIMMDDRTEEIFLDSPETSFYFDHQMLGRCLSGVVAEANDISRIITLLRSQSNQHLDTSNPSLKTELMLFSTLFRVSATVPPLSPDGLHLEIRRARSSPFSLQDLVENGTLRLDAAAVLTLAVANRLNITITGEPGSGKTTLLNALDMLVPKSWRKVYVEDAAESRDVAGSHQVRFKVDPVDELMSRSSKSQEIVKCLHRSPDYLILGEIQTKEHTEALFQALAAGLRVMQTCHSSSAAALVSRWRLSHGIQPASIGLADLIVTLRRPRPAESRRVVAEIVEICRSLQNGVLEFGGLSTVYSEEEGIQENWAPNGALSMRAKEAGMSSHTVALRSLTRALQNPQASDCNLSSACALLWENGHPMAFVYDE